jgi:hypothetical protein
MAEKTKSKSLMPLDAVWRFVSPVLKYRIIDNLSKLGKINRQRKDPSLKHINRVEKSNISPNSPFFL